MVFFSSDNLSGTSLSKLFSKILREDELLDEKEKEILSLNSFRVDSW